MTKVYVAVLDYAGGYSYNDVILSVVGVFKSEKAAQKAAYKAKYEHDEPGNCTVEVFETDLYGLEVKND